MLSKMATNLNTIFLSIVMFHLVLSAQTQMHPIHLESPAPQPHPPQSQPQTPHHNSSQYGTTEGSLQPQECGPRCGDRCSNTKYKKPCLLTNVVPSACVYLQVLMATSKSALATTTGRLSSVDLNALDLSS
ncbi:unnamed protein product [Brassica rapa subsp. trilocularis]